MTIQPLMAALRSHCSALFLMTCILLTGCSDGSDNPVAAASTLGVPGAGNPNTVAVPAAAIEGPIAGTPVLVSTFFPLEPLGYKREEFFVSGTASNYTNVNQPGADGKWQVQPGEQASYRTRIVVIRPIDAADFNGTVFVEWLNVTPGFDNAPDWGMVHTELMRSGYAWVGVSAQKAGVEALIDGSAAALLPGGGSADRYLTLAHPGDSFAFDIYSQVAQALREADANTLPGEMAPKRMIAAGESQSAYFMMTYVNAFAPLHAMFEGYFVHSRIGGAPGLDGEFIDPGSPFQTPVRVRDDLGVPVMMLQMETDLLILGSYTSRQEDSSQFRLWEAAGTAHADLYTFLDNRVDTGNNPGVAAVVESAAPIPGIIDCDFPVNSGPQHFIANAAVAALNTWIVNGIAPSKADRLEVAGAPPAFVLDDLGNVKGGVRTPYVDTPIAVLSGEGQPPVEFDPDGEITDFCFLSGTTRLFDAATLGSLYADNAAYIEALNAATDEAVDNGFLLPADAQLIKAHAASSDIFAP